jgi:hypothetical protein
MSGAQYNGVPSRIAIPASVNISSSSGPIITTVAAHGLTTGDQVDVIGHETNFLVNGTNTATVLGANTFSVPVVTSATGGPTGAVYPLTLGATFPLTANGDLADAAEFNVPYEAVGDRTAFLGTQIGGLKLVSYGEIANDVVPVAGTSWNQLNTSSTSWGPMPNILGSVFGVQQADVLQLFLSTTGYCNGPSGQYTVVSFGTVNYVPGGAGTPAKVPGSGVSVMCRTDIPFCYSTVTLASQIRMTTTGQCDIYLGVGASTAAAMQTNVIGDYFFQWFLWRTTALNQ